MEIICMYEIGQNVEPSHSVSSGQSLAVPAQRVHPWRGGPWQSGCREFLQFCETNQTNPAIKILTNPVINVLTNLVIKIPKSYLILHFCRGRISFNFVQSDVWISDGLSYDSNIMGTLHCYNMTMF